MLKHITISGYRSIAADRPVDIDFGNINLFIGANGSGKSNIVSLVGLMNSITTRTLQKYVAHNSVASLLHGGPQHTNGISLQLDFSRDAMDSSYGLRLNFGLPGRLFIADENIKYSRNGGTAPEGFAVYSDSNESGLQDCLTHEGARLAFESMARMYVYQFNNTAQGSPIRGVSGEYDCRALRCDGGNLAACLNQLKSTPAYQPYYRRIVTIVRSVMPQFNDFTLNRSADGGIWLTWRDNVRPDYDLGPHQFSDGALRFIALAVALLSPPQLMPWTIVLDEPELGLHPRAVEKLAGMMKMASSHTQLIVATQCAALVDSFSLDDVRIADWNREFGCTEIKRLDAGKYAQWLKNYAISDMWEKNIIGGQP